MARTARRSGWAVPTCLASALLLAACSNAARGSSPGGPTAKPPLLIGASMSLSGDFATLADPALKGYKLWVDTVNAQVGLLGRTVGLDVVDDPPHPPQLVLTTANLTTPAH